MIIVWIDTVIFGRGMIIITQCDKIDGVGVFELHLKGTFQRANVFNGFPSS